MDELHYRGYETLRHGFDKGYYNDNNIKNHYDYDQQEGHEQQKEQKEINDYDINGTTSTKTLSSSSISSLPLSFSLVIDAGCGTGLVGEQVSMRTYLVVFIIL